MNIQWKKLTVASRSGDSRVMKTVCAALLTAIILSPSLCAQSDRPPASKTWSVNGNEGSHLYSMHFEGGHLNDLMRLWTNTFANDNFLVNFPSDSVDLPAFEIREMTLPELARSIAFLSHNALAVEVIERNEVLPGNIWRVGRASQEGLSQTVKMRAVSAPHLFASKDTLASFLKDAELTQKKLAQVGYEIKKVANSAPWIGTEIMPLNDQHVFVLIGTEEGISGLESLIKAAEKM